MVSLHIEHPITDLATWMTAFSAIAEIRRRAGVTAEAVRHPVGDDTYVVIDLEFDTSEHANAFLRFLETQIWAVPENAPALAGTPEAKILEAVDLADGGRAQSGVATFEAASRGERVARL